MRRWVPLLGVMLVINAFGFSEKASFKKTSCPFAVPTGERVECGYLSVPENRQKNTNKTINLFVARVKSLSWKPRIDPIVYLRAPLGIASSSLLQQPQFWTQTAGLRQDRDLILMDYRGVGESQPQLSCSNVIVLSGPTYLEQIKVCHSNLIKQGVDLSAYNTKEIARDIVALMREWHVTSWNIFAAGYGTRIAQVLMKIEPHSVRSALLDSVMPFTLAGTMKERSVNNRRVFQKLFYDCDVNPACRAEYPNLQAQYTQLIRSLPKQFSDQSVSAPLVIHYLLQAIADAEQLADVPKKIKQLSELNNQGRLTRGNFFKALMRQETTLTQNFAAKLSVLCFDGDATTEQEHGQIVSIFDDTAKSPVCDIWGRAKVMDAIDAIDFPAIPTLIFTGEYNTQLSPQFSRDAAKKLPLVKLLKFKGAGHPVTSGSHCAQFISKQFFDRPDHRAEDLCVGALKSPVFVAPSLSHKSTATVEMFDFINKSQQLLASFIGQGDDDVASTH